MSEERTARSRPDRLELVIVILLSVTAILTAWTGFQAGKWGGAMSIAFSQASGARIDASRLDGNADRKQTIQVTLFTQWLQAYQSGDTQLQAFLEERFPEPLKTAFPIWLASQPLQNEDAEPTPFDLPEYVIPEAVAADAADARADRRFAEALVDNQRSDNYTALTIAFAGVLFLAGVASRVRGRVPQRILVAAAACGFVVLAGVLLAFPKLL